MMCVDGLAEARVSRGGAGPAALQLAPDHDLDLIEMLAGPAGKGVVLVMDIMPPGQRPPQLVIKWHDLASQPIYQEKAGRIAAAIAEKLAAAVKNTAAIFRCSIISSKVILSYP